MIAFILKRVLLLGVMLVGLVLIMFMISHVAPGDPAGVAAGPDATPEMIEVIRKEYGLDKPLPVQFWIYLTGVLEGDLGRSIRTTRDVAEDLARYFPATVELVMVAMAFAVLIGVPLGMLAAVFRDRWLDHAIRLISVSSVALPMFWLGLLLQYFLALKLGWLPLGGRLGLRQALEGRGQGRLVDQALVRLHPGHMGVAEQGQAVRLQLQSQIHRLRSVSRLWPGRPYIRSRLIRAMPAARRFSTTAAVCS